MSANEDVVHLVCRMVKVGDNRAVVPLMHFKHLADAEAFVEELVRRGRELAQFPVIVGVGLDGNPEARALGELLSKELGIEGWEFGMFECNVRSTSLVIPQPRLIVAH